MYVFGVGVRVAMRVAQLKATSFTSHTAEVETVTRGSMNSTLGACTVSLAQDTSTGSKKWHGLH